MQTLYIDVYFLINFTVDLISLYFSSILSKVPTSPKRLISASVAASFSAVLFVLSPERTLIKLLLAASGAIVTAFIGCKRVSGLRRARFFLCFIIFGALIGAGVNFMYGILDRWLYGRLEVAFGAANRRLLLFSLVVLLSIGVFKVIVSFFSDIRCEGSVEIEIRFQGKTQRIEAFVDSGNLAKDPLDMRPVLFIKEGIA